LENRFVDQEIDMYRLFRRLLCDASVCGRSLSQPDGENASILTNYR